MILLVALYLAAMASAAHADEYLWRSSTAGAYEMRTDIPTQEGQSDIGFLDASGDYEIPSYLNLTILRDDGSQTVEQTPIDQAPAAGTIVSGEGRTEIFITVQDTNTGHLRTAIVDLWTVDVTPPEITIVLAAHPVAQTPNGMLYFVLPKTVTPSVTATDNTGGPVTLDVTTDETPGAVAVSEKGIHAVHVVAEDEAGNVSVETVRFQLRDRPVADVRATVDHYSFTRANGQVTMDATLLVASDDIEVKDLTLGTMTLWLADAEGRWMNTSQIHIEDAYAPGANEFLHNSAKAHYDDSYWTVEFEAVYPAANFPTDPVKLSLTGRGLAGEPGAFDFIVTDLPAAASPNALAELDAQTDLTADIADDPEPEDSLLI